MKPLLRVVLKGLALFLLVNLLLGLGRNWNFGSLSLYNHTFPGRPRFPFGETPQAAYAFSLSDLDAMFASHEVSGTKPKDEYRVMIIGDSSVWGTLLRPEETLAGRLNQEHLFAPDGRKVRFYNLGYPTISLTKDLLILAQARRDQPDLVIWLTTLEAFAKDNQLSVPLVQNNPQRSLELLKRYPLNLDAGQLKLPSFWESTLIGRRKELADLMRLQLYGVMWSATGVDQVYPSDYAPAEVDLEASTSFHGVSDWGDHIQDYLDFEPIEAAVSLLGKTPLLLVNEPILISAGKNSAVRYNYYYPRWAYDRYLTELEAFTQSRQIEYLNAWNIIQADEFTNSAIHINQTGEAQLAVWLTPYLLPLGMNSPVQEAK
jgi:hypothetical protein